MLSDSGHGNFLGTDWNKIIIKENQYIYKDPQHMVHVVSILWPTWNRPNTLCPRSPILHVCRKVTVPEWGGVCGRITHYTITQLWTLNALQDTQDSTVSLVGMILQNQFIYNKNATFA